MRDQTFKLQVVGLLFLILSYVATRGWVQAVDAIMSMLFFICAVINQFKGEETTND